MFEALFLLAVASNQHLDLSEEKFTLTKYECLQLGNTIFNMHIGLSQGRTISDLHMTTEENKGNLDPNHARSLWIANILHKHIDLTDMPMEEHVSQAVTECIAGKYE